MNTTKAENCVPDILHITNTALSYMCIYMCVCTHTYTHIYVCMHVYMHMYIYKQRLLIISKFQNSFHLDSTDDEKPIRFKPCKLNHSKK